MQLVTRAQWRARPRGAGAINPFDPRGVTVHWVGAGWAWPWAHETCDDKMRAMQADHMDNRGWSDIGYSFVACPHGYVFEGRGLNRRSAANGDFESNTYWYAIQCMWGARSGSAPVLLLTACRDGIDYCRSQGGAGNELRGHRDHKSTDCPGDQLYAWARNGAPRPNQPPEDDLMSDAQYTALNAKLDKILAQTVSDTNLDVIQTNVTRAVQEFLDRWREETGVQWTAEIGRDSSERTDLGTHLTAIHGKLDTLAAAVAELKGPGQ